MSKSNVIRAEEAFGRNTVENGVAGKDLSKIQPELKDTEAAQKVFKLHNKMLERFGLPISHQWGYRSHVIAMMMTIRKEVVEEIEKRNIK